MKVPNYITEQRRRQGAFLKRTLGAEALRPEADYRLKPDDGEMNLGSEIRKQALAHFGRLEKMIQWHRHAAHGLSSQVMCVNVLMPFASRPELLKDIVSRALGRAVDRMLPVDGGPHYVDFEWIGRQDYLSEWGKSRKTTRGANATSADAVVRFEAEGRVETLLIEWKYTETYGAPPDPARETERTRRYADKAFHPNGPLRDGLGLTVRDLFWEPAYQLLRQQILAYRMQQFREDGAERVSVLHISPAGNTALHKVTAPKLKPMGTDIFTIFRSLLVDPTAFTGTTVEHAFGPTLAAHKSEPWAAYLLDRYDIAPSERSA